MLSSDNKADFASPLTRCLKFELWIGKKILLGAPHPNESCRVRLEFSRSSNVASEPRVIQVSRVRAWIEIKSCWECHTRIDHAGRDLNLVETLM